MHMHVLMQNANDLVRSTEKKKKKQGNQSKESRGNKRLKRNTWVEQRLSKAGSNVEVEFNAYGRWVSGAKIMPRFLETCE